MRNVRPAVAAAAFYLAAALWTMRVVLPAPGSMLAYSPHLAPEPAAVTLSHSDQMFVAWGIARNARALLREPGRLFDAEQCHPAPKAVTLGESMFGNALVGLVPYAVTGNPIFTLNAVVVLVLWLAAMAMYALVFHFTRSAGAALVAGFLFGFQPIRVMDPGHPFVYGNQWTPFALLFAHRLFTRERWQDAGGLALFLCLQLLESMYQIVALVLIGGVVGAWLVVRHRHRLRALAPKLALVGLAVGAFTLALTRPYLETRRAWGILGGRFSLLHVPIQFAPGHFAYPGTVMLGLALLGLAARWWGRQTRPPGDPRLVYLVAGLVTFWFVVLMIQIPGLGITIWSLAFVVGRLIPGIDSVRGLQYARAGVYLVTAFLAGWGAYALLARRGRLGRAALTAVLTAAAFLEVFAPPLARRSFGASVGLVGYRLAPDRGLVELLAGLPPGAVLDLPFEINLAGELRDMPHYVFLGAYHHHPVASCYNSYKLPTLKDIDGLVRRLPDPAAADALAALGFGSIVLHEELEPERVAPNRTAIAGLGAAGRLAPLGQAAGHTAYRLSSPLPVEADLAALAPAEPPTEQPPLRGPWARIDFGFRNQARATYRHPDPIMPTRVLVRWYGEGGTLAAEQRTRLLLPIALAPGEEAARSLMTPVPTGPGVFEVTLACVTAPERVLARRRVRVERS